MANRKIFDIKPLEEKTYPEPALARRVFLKKKLTVLLIVSFSALIFYCSFFIEPKLTIDIWPETKPVEFRTQLKISGSTEKKDISSWLEAGVLPGEFLYVENSDSGEFASSGYALKEERASGVIRVYNDYSTSPQVLIATTRFISSDGKLFRTPVKVVIPGKHYEGGKIVPGFADIEVVAGEPGEEYNIGPSAFSIPGFAGTPKYTAFYGKSFSAMSNGFKANVPQVTEEDLEKAREVLTKKVFEDAGLALKNKAGSDLIIFDKAVRQEVLEFSPLAMPGQEIRVFIAQLKARTDVLGVKRADLENFAKSYVKSKISENERFLESSFRQNYSFDSANLKGDEILLNLDIEALIYLNIDKNEIKTFSRGRGFPEISNILKSYPEIKKFRVKTWPFWAKSAPYDFGRIEVLDNF